MSDLDDDKPLKPKRGRPSKASGSNADLKKERSQVKKRKICMAKTEELRTLFSEAQTQPGPLTEKYAAFGNSVAEQFAQIIADIAIIRDQCHGFHMHRTHTSNAVNEAKHAVSELTKRIVSLETTSQMDKKYDDHEKRIDLLEHEINELTPITEKHNELTNRTELLEQEVNQLEFDTRTAREKLDAEVTKAQQHITHVEDRLDVEVTKAQQHITQVEDRLDAEVTKTQQHITQVEDRLDVEVTKIKHGITLVEDELSKKQIELEAEMMQIRSDLVAKPIQVESDLVAKPIQVESAKDMYLDQMDKLMAIIDEQAKTIKELTARLNNELPDLKEFVNSALYQLLPET